MPSAFLSILLYLSFAPGQAFAGECNGPKDDIVLYFVSMTAHIASCL